MKMSETKNQPIGRMMLRNVRVAFAQGIFEAQKVDDNSKPRFGCALLLTPDHAQLKEIKAKMNAVALEKWKGKAEAQMAALEKKDKTALHDGNDKPNYDGYPGNFYISAASQENNPPTVLNQDKSIFDAKKGHKRIYSGCYVNASIEFWAQDNAYGQRVNATLRGVQFLKDGDSFSAASAASSDEFEDVADGADAAEFS